MSEPTCDVCGATVGFCDADRYPSGSGVCVGAFKRALAVLRLERDRAVGVVRRCAGLVCIKVSREDPRDASTGDCGTCPPCAAREFLFPAPTQGSSK